LTAAISVQVNVDMKSRGWIPQPPERDEADGHMSIGELAERFGLATHVLRHWESAGLLTPAYRVAGRRRYTRDHVTRVAMILRGKEAGLSLPQLREILTATDPAARRELLERHRAELDERIARIQASKELIEHVLECGAPDFTRCPEFQELVRAMAARVPLSH
jgi:MerR family transcriptional regulator, copper efflux regulator